MDSLEQESRVVKEALRVASKSFKDLGLPPPSAKDKATVEKAYKQIKEDLARAMFTWQGALAKERGNAARVAMQTKQQHIMAYVEKFIGELNDKDQPKDAIKARIQKDDSRILSELEKLRKDIQGAVDTALEAGLDVSAEANQMVSHIEQRVLAAQSARKEALKQMTGEVLEPQQPLPERPLKVTAAAPVEEKKSPRTTNLAKEVLTRDSGSSGGKVVSPRTKIALADSAGSMSRSSGSSNRLALSPRNAADKARVKDLFSEAVEKKASITRASAGTLTDDSNKPGSGSTSKDAESSLSSSSASTTVGDGGATLTGDTASAAAAATTAEALAASKMENANKKVEDDVMGVAVDAFTDAEIKKIVQNGYRLPLKGLSSAVATRMIKELSANIISSAASRGDLENESLLNLCHEKYMYAIQKLSLPVTEPATVQFKLSAVDNALALVALMAKMDIIVFKGSALFPLLDAAMGILQSLQTVAPANVLTEKAKTIDVWRKATIKMDAGTSMRMRTAFTHQAEDLKKLQSSMDAIERQVVHLERTT